MIAILEKDLTGRNPENYIEGEVVTLIEAGHRGHRLATTQRGPYYKDSLVVRGPDGELLTEGVDYQTTYHYSDFSATAGLELCGMVVITNPEIGSQITLSYQALGGGWSVSTKEVRDAISEIDQYSVPFDWDDLIGKPLTYTPSEHQHKYWQLYGLERVIQQLDRVEYGIRTGHEAAFEMEELYLSTLVEEAEEHLDGYRQEFIAHTLDFENPHELNAEEIELERVQNYPLATTTQVLDSNNDSTYVTPLRLGDLLGATAQPELQRHLRDRTNPHEVHANQIGAHTTQEADQLLDGKLDHNAQAVDSGRLGGASYSTLRNDIRTDIPAGNITSGVFDRARLGSGGNNTHNNNYVLRGDSSWISIKSIFDQYESNAVSSYYIGHYGSNGNALNHIRVTYSNVNDYPVGTVVFFRIQSSYQGSSNNGGTTRSYSHLSAAIRTSSGWTTM